MRISDWSSDVCSSDLTDARLLLHGRRLSRDRGSAVVRRPCCRPCGPQGLLRAFEGTSQILPDHGGRARAFSRDPAVPVGAHSSALLTVALSKPRQAVGAGPAPKPFAVCYGA